jgi:hypothetical protein
VNGIAGLDVQDGRVKRGKLAIKRGGREVVTLGRSAAALGRQGCGEAVRAGMGRVSALNEDERAEKFGSGGVSERVNCSRAFFRAAFFVLREEVEGVAVDSASELVAAKVARKFAGVVLKLQAIKNGRAPEIDFDDPTPSEVGSGRCGLGRAETGAARKKQSIEKKGRRKACAWAHLLV